ncbi:hypothetical protein PR202_ga28454 [Eleusine coracana subsp. coracana]|uniref:AP2/ERF domain-containing protein n=1 Tax=Eleusine coracana subsp. coracana TaxID=191504 RepID=A0AAV5DIV8_ELECO|nr:hypothetical protein PR202_ga28454 [Eleusine coracana subsp. coracana]
MTNNNNGSSNNGSGGTANNNGGNTNAAASGGWLGFSLSPHSMASAMDDHHNVQQHHGLFFPSVTAAAAYGLAAGDATSSPYYTPQLASMPLKSDGSLCIMEALRRTDQDHHGPKLEDFLGAAQSQAMALSLDNAASSFYYYGGGGGGGGGVGGGHHHHHGLLQPASLVADDEAAAAATAMASWVAARAEQQTFLAQQQHHHHALALSMGSSCVTTTAAAHHQQHAGGGELAAAMVDGGRKRAVAAAGHQQKQPVHHRKSIDTFGQRTSQYRGVTRHRWTGRYEAHLWDNSCKKEGQTRKGRQGNISPLTWLGVLGCLSVLGGYDMEEKAARAYDLAALKYWGPSTHINFPLEDYQEELEEMKNMTRQEYVAHLRRKSSGFSRGASMYRGVTRYIYIRTQEEAAEAYDIAAIKFRGLNAVTNFDITRYDVDKIMASNTLLPGDLARRKKQDAGDDHQQVNAVDASSAAAAAAQLVHHHQANASSSDTWKIAAAMSAAPRIVGGGEHHHGHDVLSVGAEAFSSVLHDLVVNAGGADHQQQHDGGNGSVAAAGMSTSASSLVTSLSNSREGSPDRGGGLAMLFSKPPHHHHHQHQQAANNNNKPMSPMPLMGSSWAASSPPARPAVSIAHLPLFAAWTDA